MQKNLSITKLIKSLKQILDSIKNIRKKDSRIYGSFRWVGMIRKNF